MAKFKNDKDQNGMRLPSQLLEQINAKDAVEEDDERFTKFSNNSRGKKRKSDGNNQHLSRKEKRKQERELKKQKRIQTYNNNVVNHKKQEPVTQKNQNVNQKKKSIKEEDPLETLRKLKESKNLKSVLKKDKKSEIQMVKEPEEEDPMEALRALKAKKNGNSKKSEVRIVKEDDLEEEEDDDDLSDFDDLEDIEDIEDEEDEIDPMEELRKLKGNNKQTSDIRIVKVDDLEDDELSDDFDDYDEVEEDPMEALKALKAKKNGKVSESEIRIVKEDDLDDDEISDDFEDDDEEEEDPMEALRKLKGNKKSSGDSDIRIVKEDDLDDDDLSEFDDDDDDDMESEKEEEEEDDEQDPMEALRALKAKKNGESTKSSEIRIVKEDDLDDDEVSDLGSEDEEEEVQSFDEGEDEDEEEFSELEEEEDLLAKLKALKDAKKKNKKDKKSEKEIYPLNPQLQSQFERDDEDIEYYAKKLGLKNGKKSKLSKIDDDDIIGGLLDGLDLDFDSDREQVQDDDEDDFNSDEFNEDFSGDDDDEELDSDGEPRVKENPYVAPGTEDDSNDLDSDSAKPQKYIPPALRRKMALEANTTPEVSEETLRLRKSIKGPLNKLSEANINTIVNELNTLYLSHPRQTLNEEITNIILDSIIQQGRLLDTFVYLHASVVVALYRLQGVEFGAHFIQTVIEKFETYNKESTKTKESSNIISLLSSVYLFQLISCKLLYDMIKELINNLDENNADLLLRLIRNSGNQMRSDDPSALKEIVLLINDKVNTLPRDSINTRTQFLIETISSLKNNKLKVVNEGNHQLSIRLKKFLGSINNNKFGDPIQVSLDDIHNVSTRGKWWLVGSAWKGHNSEESKKKDVDELAMNDILDNAEPNWMELAKSQRMNTDIRRAIFVSIMSANDYIDAVTKLDKLSLKRNQEREIPKVLIHCATMEPSWNPYYGVLANKLCDSHSLRKTFQFMLWDLIKELDGGSAGNRDNDDDNEDDFIGFDNDTGDEESKMKRILNLGRFYGFLLAQGTMPLHNLRTINFLTASNDTVLFLEVLLVSFLDQVGKKSQKNSIGAGLKKSKKSKEMFEQKFDDKILVERILKAKDQPTLLRGLQYFLQEKVKTSDITSGKKQKQRVSWGVDAMFDIIDEFLKENEDDY